MLEIANNKMTSHARHRSSEFRSKRLGPHVMSALQVWLWLLIFVFQNELRISVSAQPGYLDFDNLPDTNFSCVGKVIGGYYADLETSCQMFHVCTIGQQEEAMDIKFLCLNGTVFDQETRVCERVDEVDCSKSERFYNLNLELYGNTAPPFIEPEQAPNPIEPEEENVEDDEEQYEEDEVDYSESSTTTTRPQTTTTSPTTQTTTLPTTTARYTTTQYSTTHYRTTTHYKDETTTKLEEDGDDYTLSDNKDTNQSHEDYKVEHKFSSGQNYVTDRNNANVSPTFSTGGKLNPSYGPPTHDTRSDMPPQYQVHKIISPQEFIYQHSPQSNQGNKNEAISFQQQTFLNNGQNSHLTVTSHNVDHKSQVDNKGNENSLAENIYITSSTPRTNNRYSEVEQIDKYEIYESSKNIPQISLNRPPTVSPILSPPKQQIGPFQFSLKNPSRIPQGFKLNPTTQNPHSQILSPNSKNNLQNSNQFGTARPIQSYQPSERHEILFENRYQLPTEIPLAHDYNQYHYERKRSHDVQQPLQGNDQIIPRSVPKTTTEQNRWVPHRNSPKSPPRVIVTASASVSDSNGKKLNYTVGNVVHAVKPIVPVNYDNFKEEDVIVDPFFLDVPKLVKKRSERHAPNDRRMKRNTVINISTHPNGSRKIEENVTQDVEDAPVVVDQDIKVEHVNNTSNTTIANTKYTAVPNDTTTKWTPPDYVDDNYEPLVYEDPKSNNSDTSEIPKDEPDLSDLITSTTPWSETKSPNKSKKIEKNKTDYIKEYLNKLTEFHMIVKDNSEKYLQLNLDFEKTRQLNKVDLVTSKPFYEMNKSSHLEKPSVVKKPANLVDTRTSILRQTTLKPILTTFRPGMKYTLVTITTSLNLESSETKNEFTCSGKDFHRFYPDLINCQNFHLCTPGYNKYQVLDMVFECDSNLWFNYETLECSSDKSNNCSSN